MFNVDNAMRFNNKDTVDAEFSAILAEINYTNDLFVPGETYNDEMDEKAGQVFVRKLGKGTVKGTDATAADGLHFDTDQNADTLVVMNKIYVLSKSELCPAAIDVARKSGKLAQKKDVVVRSHGEAWQAQGVALLLKESNHTKDADTDEITPENAVDKILAVQQQIIESDADADVCFVSPHVRTCLLSNFAKGKGFIPETNEEAKRKGVIGDLLGLKVKWTNFLGKASNITGKITGENVHQDIKDGAKAAKNVDFIVFDHKTYYIDTVFEGLRENPYIQGYFGCSVDVQSISGALNTNPERCVVHSHAAASVSTQSENKAA